jgi:hypothetical protein
MRRRRPCGQESNQRLHLIQSTGVLSTACREGGLGNWGRLSMSGGRASNIVRKGDDSSGRRKGSEVGKKPVMPVEGRALTLDRLLKKKRTGDWR